jgi:hypothetical protein
MSDTIDRKAYMKQYYEKNREKLAEKQKAHYEANKEHYAAYTAAYYPEWYEKNKEALLARRKTQETCQCGASFTHRNKARHLQTQKHLAFINTKEAPIQPDL